MLDRSVVQTWVVVVLLPVLEEERVVGDLFAGERLPMHSFNPVARLGVFVAVSGECGAADGLVCGSEEFTCCLPSHVVAQVEDFSFSFSHCSERSI